MKKNLILSALIILASLPAWSIETVESVDLQRYLGLWHQISAIPQDFSKDCVRNTTAEYKEDPSGSIQVLNSCEEQDGSVNVAEGRARVNPKFNSTAKLEVTFVKFFFGWVWPFAGDYWVINLDENYGWSVVGHPDLEYLWILSREKTMEPTQLKSLRDFIESVGYDSCDMLMSPNPENSYSGSERLCDLVL